MTDGYTSKPLMFTGTAIADALATVSESAVAEGAVVDAARKWAALYNGSQQWKTRRDFFAQEELALLEAVEALVTAEHRAEVVSGC